MTDLHQSGSIVIARSSEEVYDMVADVTRMGEFSPVCRECWWEDDAGGPAVGAWFGGRNQTPDREWKTRSQVVVADRAREFAFMLGGAYARWGYTFAPVDGGTEVTESWEFLPDGQAFFEERFGDEAEATIAARSESARTGIVETLAAIKRAAESD
jgi:hypothetical protein